MTSSGWQKRYKEYAFNYLYNIATWLSQGINTVVFFGDPDESLSSRIGKSIVNKGWAASIPWPFFVYNHFIRSVEDDRGMYGTFTRKTRY